MKATRGLIAPEWDAVLATFEHPHYEGVGDRLVEPPNNFGKTWLF
jgi:hypothetical protein